MKLKSTIIIAASIATVLMAGCRWPEEKKTPLQQHPGYGSTQQHNTGGNQYSGSVGTPPQHNPGGNQYSGTVGTPPAPTPPPAPQPAPQPTPILPEQGGTHPGYGNEGGNQYNGSITPPPSQGGNQYN